MTTFSEQHPIIFGAALFFASLAAALVVMLPLQLVGLDTEFAAALGRICVGAALLFLFRSRIAWSRSFSGFRYAAPVLLVVAWNVAYHLLNGSPLVTPAGMVGAVVLGFAPAIFEEAIFRGAVIGAMRDGGKSLWFSLFGSAALFAVVHLTNAVGMDLPSALIQLLYSFAVGLLLGAIYLKSQDIVTVIASHAAIDISNQIFATNPVTESPLAIAIFVAVLIVIAAYGILLVKGMAAAPNAK